MAVGGATGWLVLGAHISIKWWGCQQQGRALQHNGHNNLHQFAAAAKWVVVRISSTISIFPEHSSALAPEVATITASLNLVPQEWRIDVLLFVNKLIAKHNASTKICPYQNNCLFQKLCWYQHQTPTTHDPYATSPCFSSRNRAPRDSATTLPSNFDQIKPQNVSLPGTLLPSASTVLGPTNIYSPHHPPPPQPSTSAAAPCKQLRSRRSSSPTAISSVEFVPLAGAQAESHNAADEHRNSSERKTPPEITSSHQDEPQSDTSSLSIKWEVDFSLQETKPF